MMELRSSSYKRVSSICGCRSDGKSFPFASGPPKSCRRNIWSTIGLIRWSSWSLGIAAIVPPYGIYVQVPTGVHDVFSRSIPDEIDAQLILGSDKEALSVYHSECCKRNLLNRPDGTADSAGLN